MFVIDIATSIYSSYITYTHITGKVVIDIAQRWTLGMLCNDTYASLDADSSEVWTGL